jgi:Tfp pilus assembly protein PilN
MRPVNLLPGSEKSGAAADPRVAYGIVGGLGVLLVMVLLAIMYSNKATTLNDEAAALQAEAQQHAIAAKPVVKFNDFADEVNKRTLLIGGLAESRFPWNTALRNLSQAIPKDVTLDSITASNAASGGEGQEQAAATTSGGSTLTLNGCASGWFGFSRFLVRLKEMPGVIDVKTQTSDVAAGAGGGAGSASASGSPEQDRKDNCGPMPLSFALTVNFEPQKIDLTGLPKIESATGGSTGATGAAPAAPAPATEPAAAAAAGE